MEDFASFTLRFPSGVFAVGTSGYSSYNSRRLRAMATDGWIDMDPAFAYSGLVTHVGRKLGESDVREQRTFEPKNQFAVEMDHFAEAIRADREPHTPGEEGLQDQRIIAAIYEAAAGGGIGQAADRRTKRDAFRGPLAPAKGSLHKLRPVGCNLLLQALFAANDRERSRDTGGPRR